jgi:hypothetical protein
LPEITIKQIEHFFSHYKDLEPGKWVKIKRWGDAAEANCGGNGASKTGMRRDPAVMPVSAVCPLLYSTEHSRTRLACTAIEEVRRRVRRSTPSHIAADGCAATCTHSATVTSDRRCAGIPDGVHALVGTAASFGVRAPICSRLPR